MAEGDAPESEILRQARDGDADALQALLEHYEPLLYRFAMRMCRDKEDARDVLQESMLAAARTLSGFRGDAQMSTWLHKIARSFCIKKRRKSRFAPDRHESLDADDVVVTDPGRQPEDEAAHRQLVRAVEQAIDGLDEASREVLVLRDVQGLTAAEVADVLEMSVPQVKSRLHRARASVRERLNGLVGREDGRSRPNCPDVLTLFSKNLEGEISQDLCREMQEHVDGCDACRSTCDSLKETLAACSALPTPTVPEDVQRSVREHLRALARGSQ